MRQQLKQQWCQAQGAITKKRTLAGFFGLRYLFPLITSIFVIDKYRDKVLRKLINTRRILWSIFVMDGLP